MIVQRFNLNLIPNQSPVIVHVNQYDTGTGRLIATLYEGNEPYSPNGTAVIQGTKPDGHGFQYTATLDGNVVTADLTEQMAPVAGDVRTQIVVTESSGVTGTFAFIIRVQPSALPSDTDMSESDYQYIEEAIREAQEAVQTAQEATETAQEAVERAQEAITETHENAENSEAWAQGTRGGIPVGPTDPTYEHNAEYWAQYAERYAQGGLHYKASIPFADIPTTGMREGDMYDITDDFTTDSRFEEGAGIEVKGGTNIAWNSDNKWDILALPYIPKTTFNGRSGSILPMVGDYDSKKILLTSALHIGGETQNDVQEALEALSNDGVKSFNGRSGSVLPMAGDYDSKKILLTSALHIGGETQNDVQEALEVLEGNKADKVDNAIADNFAGLDANGNLKDSGKNASDFATPSDIAGQQSLLKDTVGWTGKNLLKNTATSRTVSGVTFTVNADGSVTVNGTSTASSASDCDINYVEITKLGRNPIILTGCPSGGDTSTYRLLARELKSDGTDNPAHLDVGNGVEFTPLETTAKIRVYISVKTGVTVNNLVFKPMLRRADITDPTYEPYHESVEVMYEEEIHGVNLLPNTAVNGTKNGITFTVNADGSITANGTATANADFRIVIPSDVFAPPSGEYIISRGGSLTSDVQLYVNLYNGTNYVRQITNLLSVEEFKFTLDYNGYDRIVVGIFVNSGKTINNFVIKPMLRKATIEDSTYRPYNPQAIQNQLNAQGVLGAKNLLPNNVTSRTINGVTFTVNSDGSVTVNGTADPTATGNAWYPYYIGKMPAGKYLLNGCPTGGQETNGYFLFFRKDPDNASFRYYDTGNGVLIDIPDDNSTFICFINVWKGVTVNNLIFKPMLRLASDPDDTYQPYAMTNRELTEKKINIADLKTVVSASSDFTDFKTRIASL